MTRMPLADEGDFLLVLGRPGSSEDLVGDWILGMEGDGGYDDGGWIIPFPSDSPGPEQPREIDVVVHRTDEEPAPVEGGFTKVVEVSIYAPAILTGSGGEVDLTPDEGGPYRLRLMLDDSAEAPRLVVVSWPAPAASGRLIVGTTEPAAEYVSPALHLPEAAAGLAAAARIGDDVDDAPTARVFSGRLGTARARRVVPRAPKWHSEFFERGYVWTPAADGSIVEYRLEPLDPLTPGGPFWSLCAMWLEDHPDRVTGWRGSIWTTPHPDDSPPHRSVLWWKWVRRSPPPSKWDITLGDMGPVVLAQDTVRTATFTAVPGRSKTTEIVIEHRDVPEEWVDDLSDWWTYQLAIHDLRT